MPRMAITHIQKMEPGPPLMMAVAMPTMLPVPMVAARAVQRLWNWLMALSSRLVWAVMCLSVKMAPMVLRIQWAKWANWNPPVPDGHAQAGGKQQRQAEGAPDKAVDGAVQAGDGFDHDVTLPLPKNVKKKKTPVPASELSAMSVQISRKRGCFVWHRSTS